MEDALRKYNCNPGCSSAEDINGIKRELDNLECIMTGVATRAKGPMVRTGRSKPFFLNLEQSHESQLRMKTLDKMRKTDNTITNDMEEALDV